MSSSIRKADNMTGHRTRRDKLFRKQAETDLATQSLTDFKKAPRGIGKSAAAYWSKIVTRLEEVELLEVLDTETLKIYCQQLARRDNLQTLCEMLLADASKTDREAGSTESIDRLDGLLNRLASLEKGLLSYADKLGFTPQSRARLAQRRSAIQDDPDIDLFGV